jgi:hypothetical protein
MKKSQKIIINLSFFEVNTKKCGDGHLICSATHTSGKKADVKIEKIDENIFRVKFYPLETGRLRLHLDFIDMNKRRVVIKTAK